MKIALLMLGLPVLLVGIILFINRPQPVAVAGRAPEDFPREGFAHDGFEVLLRRFVDAEGRVDYASWLADGDALDALDAYLAAVAAYSPENAPRRFPTRNDELAYWIYAYNGWVIRSILERWPLESVTDVRAPLELVRGLGFFYRLRFVFGGKAYSLYAVENKKIRRDYRDARIHFVLNCGSESCPVLRPELPDGEALEGLLQKAAADFVSDERNVSVDHENRRVVLSSIFKWYRKDFINDLHRRGLPAERGLLDYVASVAPDALRKDLVAASGYEIVFADYDWSVNDVTALPRS